MTNPLFSVIVPLFNHERYVGEAIRSVLRQSETDLELIIIDDGSTDNSAQVVESFKDSRISYHYQANCGAHSALNRGLAMANGAFLAILNSDDVFHSDRLHHALEAFETMPGLEAYFSAYHYIDDSSAIIRDADDILKGVKLTHPSSASPSGVISEECDEWVLVLLSGNVFHTTSNLVIRSSAFERIGLFRPLRYVHDYDFFLRLSANGRIFFDERPLLNYRFHGNNTISENAVCSVYETISVIAEFLAGWRPKNKALEPDMPFKYFRHFFQDLRLYGGERFLLALTLADQLFHDKGAVTDRPFIRMLAEDESVAQLVKPALQESVSYNQLLEQTNWQKTQTDHWWRKSQELESELTWQKEQTDHWWRSSQENQQTLKEMQQKLNQANRFLGIPNVKENIKRKLISIFNKEDSE